MASHAWRSDRRHAVQSRRPPAFSALLLPLPSRLSQALRATVAEILFWVKNPVYPAAAFVVEDHGPLRHTLRHSSLAGPEKTL
jgi:hypothetical protein